MSLKVWNNLISNLKRHCTNINVSYYQLTLGTQHATTGIYAKSFAAAQTKEMAIITNEDRDIATSLGFFIDGDAIGFSFFMPEFGDQIKDAGNIYYVVENVVPNEAGDKTFFYVSQLLRMPFHE